MQPLRVYLSREEKKGNRCYCWKPLLSVGKFDSFVKKNRQNISLSHDEIKCNKQSGWNIYDSFSQERSSAE